MRVVNGDARALLARAQCPGDATWEQPSILPAAAAPPRCAAECPRRPFSLVPGGTRVSARQGQVGMAPVGLPMRSPSLAPVLWPDQPSWARGAAGSGALLYPAGTRRSEQRAAPRLSESPRLGARRLEPNNQNVKDLRAVLVLCE